MAKIQIDPNDVYGQIAAEKRLKVYTAFNPYFSNDNQIEITTLEQVFFFHKKIGSTRVLGEFAKDASVKKRKRKKVFKDLLNFWDSEYHKQIEAQKNQLLKKTTGLSRKRIKTIHYLFVNLLIFISILAILLSRKVSYLTNFPFIKNYVRNFYTMIEKPFHHNLLIFLIYLSIMTILYIIVLRTYFETLKKVGTNAEAFINNEFKKINFSFIAQQKKIKKHLLKSVNKIYKKNYNINKVFDPNVLIKKLEGYSEFIEQKVIKFRKKYRMLLFIQFLLKLSVISIIAYIGYNYYNIYY